MIQQSEAKVSVRDAHRMANESLLQEIAAGPQESKPSCQINFVFERSPNLDFYVKCASS